MERCAGSRVGGDDLRAAIRDYGCTVVAPPADYKFFRMIELEARAVPTWSVEADVWTEEEGASDLTLQLTIAVDLDERSIRLDGNGVLELDAAIAPARRQPARSRAAYGAPARHPRADATSARSGPPAW